MTFLREEGVMCPFQGAEHQCVHRVLLDIVRNLQDGMNIGQIESNRDSCKNNNTMKQGEKFIPYLNL